MLRVQGSRIQSGYSLLRRSSLLRGELLVAGVRVKLEMARTLLQTVSLSLWEVTKGSHEKTQCCVGLGVKGFQKTAAHIPFQK